MHVKNPTLLGAAIIPNADLSAAGSQIPFSIEGLSGDIFLAAFLDDDGNLDPGSPRPDDGDPVLAEGVGDGTLTCVELDVTDDVTDVAIDLNAIAMPL